MNIRQIKSQIFTLFSYIAVLFAAGAVFFRPQAAMEGVSRGLALCCNTIIPSLFPFLVLSQLILESPVADFLGILFLPYTRLLGIRSRKAPSALLCGILGGFAAGAKGIDTLYQNGDLDKTQAQRLLVCTIGSGPAFIVGSVGTVMLGNSQAGWFLLLSQISASFILALLLKNIKIEPDSSAISPAAFSKPARGLINAVSQAVTSTAMLCGYITLFSFFAAIAVPASANSWTQFIVTLFLEVTSACAAATAGNLPQAVMLCSAALSLMGASVFLQVRALSSSALSLKPLLLSRILHLPLAGAILLLLLKFFPLAQSASASVWPNVVTVRMPTDVACILFVLCALVFGGERQRKGLLRRTKRV